MARILAALPMALEYARQDKSAAEFSRALQAVGLGARSSEVYKLYGIAKSIVSTERNDVFADQRFPPSEDEMRPWPTKKATGVRQNISLVYRDNVTGEILRTHYAVVSPNGIPREQAVNQAIAAYSDQETRYNQTIIGAVHTSSFRMTPFSVSEP